MSANNATLLHFLIELRKRLLHCLLAWMLILLALLYFTNQIYALLALPLVKLLPHGHGLIAIDLVSSFFVPFKLTLVVSLFCSIPIFLYQFWMFIVPALYRHERRWMWLLLLISTFLFYLGVAFAYFIVFPLLFSFLTKTAPSGVLISRIFLNI